MKQTAVEWFAERIQSDKIFNFENVLKQAIEMEKQQIINAYQTSHISMMTAEQYYNETYNQ
jgi:hypothetical protein